MSYSIAAARLASVAAISFSACAALVVTGHPGEDGEPALALIHPRLRHAATAVGLLEVITPASHRQGARRHRELERRVGFAHHDGHVRAPASDPVLVLALEDGTERRSGGAPHPLATGVLGRPLPHPGQIGHQGPHFLARRGDVSRDGGGVGHGPDVVWGHGTGAFRRTPSPSPNPSPMATASSMLQTLSRPKSASAEEERLHRKQKLAGALRLFGRFGFSEGVAGHITARDPELTDHFWVNPFGMSFRHVRRVRPDPRQPRRRGCRGEPPGQPGRVRHPLRRPRGAPRRRRRRPRALDLRQGLVVARAPARPDYSRRLRLLRRPHRLQ